MVLVEQRMEKHTQEPLLLMGQILSVQNEILQIQTFQDQDQVRVGFVLLQMDEIHRLCVVQVVIRSRTPVTLHSLPVTASVVVLSQQELRVLQTNLGH